MTLAILSIPALLLSLLALAVVLWPARNAALGAWTLARWPRKKRSGSALAAGLRDVAADEARARLNGARRGGDTLGGGENLDE